MEEKKKLRQQMKDKLKSVQPALMKQRSQEIHQRLFNSELWIEARTIAVTVSQGAEIDTREIIEQGWKENKTVVVPKCLPKEKQLNFRKISSYNQLETVFYGLLEPKIDETAAVGKEEIDLIIVPGLLFDRDGYRIGFGGGYYDRFLKDAEALKMAQAMDIQIAERIPHEKHDIPVDIIMTPTEVIRCGGD